MSNPPWSFSRDFATLVTRKESERRICWRRTSGFCRESRVSGWRRMWSTMSRRRSSSRRPKRLRRLIWSRSGGEHLVILLFCKNSVIKNERVFFAKIVKTLSDTSNSSWKRRRSARNRWLKCGLRTAWRFSMTAIKGDWLCLHWRWE